MSKLLGELNKYKESCLDDDGYIIEGKAEDLVFQSAELIERYEKVLKNISEMEQVGFHPEYVIKRYSEYAKNALDGKFED